MGIFINQYFVTLTRGHICNKSQQVFPAFVWLPNVMKTRPRPDTNSARAYKDVYR